MGRAFDQFVRFSTDAYGLERILRLLQASLQIIRNYDILSSILLIALDSYLSYSYPHPTSSSDVKRQRSGPPRGETTILGTTFELKNVNPNRVTANTVLLTKNIALARRYIRVFRFLESFSSAYQSFSSLLSSPDPTPTQKKKPSRLARTRVEIHLDILSKTFNGLYLLFEASTLVDATGIPVWGTATERVLSVEAQRFWFASLLCSGLAGVVRIVKVIVLTPLPHPPAHPAADLNPPTPSNKEEEVQEDEKFDIKKEQARLRAMVQTQRLRRREYVRAIRSQVSVLARRVLVDGLDALIPGSVIGYTNVSPGTVALAMFATTVLSGWDVWVRCGREIGGV
ncbi:hypothetical protein F5Y17DRAFT_172023 [Xylariaceae sp. FL0594]|nr:hypothetical protein F5Y17DRAFT_172023 [Xylariaceae sp. FL0594]